jgi:hypothetical protein
MMIPWRKLPETTQEPEVPDARLIISDIRVAKHFVEITETYLKDGEDIFFP